MHPSTQTKRILRVKQLCSTIGLAKSTIYDYLDPKSPRHDPSFPKPIKLGSAAVGWIAVEVDHWIQSKASARAGQH